MSIMRTEHILLIFTAAALAFSGCADRPAGEIPEDGYKLTIAASGHSISVGTKLVDLNNDMIYAYPYNLSNPDLNGIAITPSASDTGTFTYLMPQPAQDVLFSNLTESSSGYEIVTDSETALYSITTGASYSGYNDDFVVGCLDESTAAANTSGEVMPVNLERKVARATVYLKVRKADGSGFVDSLSSVLSYVSFSIPTYSSYEITDITPEGIVGSYSGEAAFRWDNMTAPDDSIMNFTWYGFVFPSIGTEPPTVTLTLTTPSGNVQTLSAQMSQPIVANKHYDLTFVVNQRSVGFDFTVESYVEENMEVGFDNGDLVPLTVTPEMAVSMTKADDGQDFAVGTDDLYCYCFDESDMLMEGFPKKQSAIINGSYQYLVPKGEHRLWFLNKDIYSDSEYSCSLTVKNLYDISVTSKSLLSTTPVIFGDTERRVDIGDQGLSTGIELERITSGLQVLLNIDNPNNLPVDELISYIWVRIWNIAENWGIENDSRYNNNGRYSYRSEAFTPATLTTVNYNDRTYYSLIEPRVMITLGDYYSMTVCLDILNAQGEPFSYISHFSTGDNAQNHVIILNINANNLL